MAARIPQTGNLTDDVVHNGTEHGHVVTHSRKDHAGWTDVTASEFLNEVRAVAKGFIAAGIQEGERIAILSRTRYEWTLVDYAIWFAGCVTVPIYDTSSIDQVRWILGDSKATALVVERTSQRAGLGGGQTNLEHLKTWVIEDSAVEQLVSSGAEVSDSELEKRRTVATPASLATIVYTSGTTGDPKGCMLSHGNFMFELTAAVEDLETLFAQEGASTLLFLPLAHVFARAIQVGAIRRRVRLGHSANMTNLVADLRDFEPTFILAVPRILEKIVNIASQNAAAAGRGRLFDRATDAAIQYSRALDRGDPGLRARAKHALFDWLVYSKLRLGLGGRCAFVVSGGAPLGERLGHFFRGVGMPVLDGYGLTETTGALTVNRPGQLKVGTVGQPLAGTHIRIADDGELLAKGGQIFIGYWNDQAATRNALTADGWFHTGDLGEIDSEGYLRITGRKKDILVTAGGKNVAPSVLEDRLRAHPLVDQCMVVGDGQPFVAALVTLDVEVTRTWAEQHAKGHDLETLSRDDALLKEIQAAVDDANLAVSQAESIRRFKVLPVAWSEEDGHLTPSLKLRRTVLLREFRDDVESLYTT